MGGCMANFEGMLDEVDNPSEVNRVGVGTSARDNPVKREPNAMCRDGVVKGGEVKPNTAQGSPPSPPLLMGNSPWKASLSWSSSTCSSSTSPSPCPLFYSPSYFILHFFLFF